MRHIGLAFAGEGYTASSHQDPSSIVVFCRNKLMQAAFTLQEVKMKYLLLGMAVLGLTTIMFVMLTKAVCVEMRDRAGRGKTGRRN